MNRRFRLTRSDDIKRVRRLGKAYAHPLVVLIASPNEALHIRATVIATRTIGGAVERNRAKRLLKAAIRPLLPRLAQGWDILLLARRPVLAAPYPEIQAALETLVERANLVREVYVG